MTITCGNCGAKIEVPQSVTHDQVISFVCHSCHQVRKEQLKYNAHETESYIDEDDCIHEPICAEDM